VYFFRLAQRVFRRAGQPAGDGGVGVGGRDHGAVEDQEQHEANGRDCERLRERVDVQASAAGAVRPVRVIAELVAVVPHAVDWRVIMREGVILRGSRPARRRAIGPAPGIDRERSPATFGI
jgi:hypothetical protein